MRTSLPGPFSASRILFIPPFSVLFLSVLFLSWCQRLLVRAALRGAPVPPSAAAVWPGSDGLRLWAGDLHFHISPPDMIEEVHRPLAESLELLRRSELDFVV